MIKKRIQLFWYEKQPTKNVYRELKKTLFHLKSDGIDLFLKKLDKDYEQIESDHIAKSILDSRYRKFRTRVIFSIFLVLSLFYVLIVKSELYESKTALIVKDMQTNTTSDSLGLSLLGVGASSQLQDSKIVEAYLKSLDVYKIIDKKFNLTDYYKSDELDFISRLSEDATQEEVLEFYNKHLIVDYDEISGILRVAFSHTDRKKAQEILKVLVAQVEEQINELNKRKAEKQLAFVRMEHEKARKNMDASSAKLERYQNENLLLDPNAEASATGGMIAELEATLLQKKIEYSTMSSYLKEDNYELKGLKKEIEEIKNSIEKERKKLTGTSGDKLNKVLFEYDKLKLQLEFDTEVYKNTLIQLETTKINVEKNAKMLSILSKPNLPDGYTYPDKPKMFFTIFFIILLMYGVFSMLSTIIKDHRD